MSKLSKFKKAHPEVAALIKSLLASVLFGVQPDERAFFAAAHAELDSDGDGVPDALETNAEDVTAPVPTPTVTRTPRTRKPAQ